METLKAKDRRTLGLRGRSPIWILIREGATGAVPYILYKQTIKLSDLLTLCLSSISQWFNKYLNSTSEHPKVLKLLLIKRPLKDLLPKLGLELYRIFAEAGYPLPDTENLQPQPLPVPGELP